MVEVLQCASVALSVVDNARGGQILRIALPAAEHLASAVDLGDRKGSVLATEAAKTQGKGSVLGHEGQWKHKEKAAS